MAKSYLEEKYSYWRKYFNTKVVQFIDETTTEKYIYSNGVKIHIDVYKQKKNEIKEKKAWKGREKKSKQKDYPVLIFIHGANTYSRIYSKLTYYIYKKKYHVVVPDLHSHGLSDGTRGDYTVEQCVQNIIDTYNFIKKEFPHSPVYLCGGSNGGALCIYAAMKGIRVHAISILNLYNFGEKDLLFGTSKYWWQKLFLKTNLNFGSKLFGNFKNNIILFSKFWDMINQDNEVDIQFKKLWLEDNIVIFNPKIRSILSLAITPPPRTYQELNVPTLVFVQGQDNMVPPEITRKNYKLLKCPKKLVKLDGYGHWSMLDDFYIQMVEQTDKFFANTKLIYS